MRSLAVCLLFALPPAAFSAGPAWTPPAPAGLERLERSLASWHSQYDEAARMPRRPFSSPGYHTTLQGGFVHATRDALNYALGLLDTGRPEHLPRATAILERVVALQDTDPASRTYGIWSWFLEEPLDRMSPPDWNWADFNGVTLLQVARDHRARLSPELARAVDAAIIHAAHAIKRRNVGPGYTNIAIMGTYVTLVAGELFALPEFQTYGRERLRRFHTYTQENGTFEEYNSPTYTVVALLELSRLEAHVEDAGSRLLIASLVRHAWEEIATHFHAPTRQWAGPHSRAYQSLLSSSTLALIQRATAGRVDFNLNLPDREELRLPVTCPPDLEPHFRTLTGPRAFTRTFIKRSRTVGTTYLHPAFALGTINKGDLWNQRRALLLHFGTPAAPGYLQLRFLKNGYDFSSAILTASQRDGLVVGAVNFITNGGDTHLSLQKVKEGKITARDLRLRFELGGEAGLTAQIALREDAAATIKVAGVAVHLSVARARFGANAGRLVTDTDARTRWLDIVLHEGVEREFDLAALEEAIVGFVLSVGPHGKVDPAVADGVLSLTCDDLHTSARLKPAPR